MSQEIINQQPDLTMLHRYTGGTVLEHIAVPVELPSLRQPMPPPPPTPPTPMQTHTRSGERGVTISDDQDQEYLYE
jgi:hypothetical protein